MDASSYTAARANLAKTMEKVCNDHTPIIITRKRESAVVMLSLDDYQALEEKQHKWFRPSHLMTKMRCLWIRMFFGLPIGLG